MSKLGERNYLSELHSDGLLTHYKLHFVDKFILCNRIIFDVDGNVDHTCFQKEPLGKEAF